MSTFLLAKRKVRRKTASGRIRFPHLFLLLVCKTKNQHPYTAPYITKYMSFLNCCITPHSAIPLAPPFLTVWMQYDLSDSACLRHLPQKIPSLWIHMSRKKSCKSPYIFLFFVRMHKFYKIIYANNTNLNFKKAFPFPFFYGIIVASQK